MSQRRRPKRYDFAPVRHRRPNADQSRLGSEKTGTGQPDAGTNGYGFASNERAVDIVKLELKGGNEVSEANEVTL